MPEQKQRVLFVSHAASMSGAPIIFLGMIREFKRQTSIPFQILVFEDGPLVEEFKSLGKTFVWKKTYRKGQVARISQLLRGLYILFAVRKNSLVFFNTITNGHLHKKMLFLKSKTACYVHELESAIHMLTNQQTLSIVLNNTDLFFAGSEAVKNNLVNNHRVDKNKIRISYSSVTETYREKRQFEDFINLFRTKNEIPGNALLIGVVGPNEWRKGFDLFFPLITLYFNLYPESNVYFVWKGFKEKNVSSFFHLYDAQRSRHGRRALIIPHGSDSLEHMACLDIHLLLSREDPYPLVVLEAASFGIPTVSFLDAGGSPEFIGNDSGICVPYGDLIKMATALHGLAENPDLREKMGATGREKVRTTHDQKKITHDIIEAITKL